MQIIDDKKFKRKVISLEKYFEYSGELFSTYFFDQNDSPIVIKITNTIETIHNHNDHDHNCIGCNLGKSINHIYFNLLSTPNNYGVEYPFKLFFFLSYLLVEQIEFIYAIFKKREYLRDTDEFSPKYPTFIKIKRWANFFKHPKYFILVHHPDFTYERHSSFKKLMNQVNKIVIDDDFIKKYYKGEGNKELLFREIANKKNIVVVFPDLFKLIIDFSKDMNRFIENISENPDYVRIINEEATLENFFELDTED